jgi:hypothetical protein
MLGLILALFTLPTELDLAHRLTTNRDYEKSDALLGKMKPTPEQKAQFYFLKACNAFALNRKDEASKWLESMGNFFGDNPPPERYTAVCLIMKYEIDQWKKGDLSDIGRKMNISGDRLTNSYGGPKTQEIQKEIISDLDKLIKEKEDQANGKDKKDSKEDQANGKQKQQQGKQPSDGQSSKPMEDSNPGGQSGKGAVNEVKLREYTQNWGKMNDRDRATAMNELTRDLPPRYKVIIEEYFKALSRHTP